MAAVAGADMGRMALTIVKHRPPQGTSPQLKRVCEKSECEIGLHRQMTLRAPATPCSQRACDQKSEDFENLFASHRFATQFIFGI